LLPFAESLAEYYQVLKNAEGYRVRGLLLGDVLFSFALLVAFLPTLITKKIIYGGFFKFGYVEHWFWTSPAFFKVVFSSDHGFLAWTPVLILSVIGLIALLRKNVNLAIPLLSVLILYIYVIGCYQDWDGISSFGNRFFVSLTPIFVIGLAGFFDFLARAWQPRRAIWAASGATAVLILFNLGLIFQWGTHLIPARGPISWRTVAYNQVVVVPEMAGGMVKSYLTGRSQLMNHIEQEDVKEITAGESEATHRVA
jgi:hypothetical protein